MRLMLLRDLIELPAQVTRGDFVLALDQGVKDAEGTVGDYVVTPKLADHFDEALTFIKGALETRRSKGTYLDGSFGSGKSHFMAILHLLLQGNVKARSLPGLAKVVTKHDAWLQGKRFLMVPYHMIGAMSLESAILGGYVRHVAEIHAEAPTPAVFRSQEIIKNARSLLARMGEEPFFTQLNERGGSGDETDGWGDLGSGWDRASFEAAVKAGPQSADHRRLVGDLIDSFFSAVRKEGEYVRIDEGLSVMSQHTKALGYDALVLFLDEMILWLASKASDHSFISAEVPKVSKLVESERSERPVPIISFVARQRDLRELIGDSVAGAQALAFADQLKFWEGRFGSIKLEDANLPFIAEKRVLKPKSEEAKLAIDEEFARTEKLHADVLRVLLTSHSNREAFRKLYPFSPALVETLVAVSSLLQRERTALKIMLQLLVDQKDTLKLGELVPVGDLYGQIAQGDEAFSSDMKRHFDTADTLYRQHLAPILEEQCGCTFQEAKELGPNDPKVQALINDDRLVKTLLLSALAPEVESLKNLTPGKLAALNHGTIKTPIGGQEGAIVLGKVRQWAGHLGQIKISDGTNQPVIAIQLSGVDVDAILDKAAASDNPGNRIRLLKSTLFDLLGIQEGDDLWIEHKFRWRGTDRRCKVFFQNVWEAEDGTFEETGDEWKVIVDYPIDRENRGPSDDLARIERFESERGSARTIAWLPSLFSAQAQREIGILVRLENILAESRFHDFVKDLSPVDRESARGILRNKQEALRNRLIVHLTTAYGLQTDSSGSLDPMHTLTGDDQFRSLASDLDLRVPGATHLKPALHEILDQALSQQYPAHPRFDEEVKITKSSVQKVLDVIQETLRSKERRVLVEKPQRAVIRQIANPLMLGEMGETHFVIGERWKDHFNRSAAKEGVIESFKVSRMRQWIDEPEPKGLPEILQDLIILTYAQQTNRSFSLHGGSYEVNLGNLRDECDCRQQPLPSEACWERAIEIAETALGVTNLPPFLSGQNVIRFSEQVIATTKEWLGPARRLVDVLRQRAADFGAEGKDWRRLSTARDACTLLETIAGKRDGKVVDGLAELELSASLEAIGSSLRKAGAVAEGVDNANLTAVEAAKKIPGVAGEKAERLWHELCEAFQNDEYVSDFVQKLQGVNDECVALLGSAVEAAAVRTSPVARGSPELRTQPAISPSDQERIRQAGRSQVEGDCLPSWLPGDMAPRLLEVVNLETTTGETAKVIVSANLGRLLADCKDAVVDVEARRVDIPSLQIQLHLSEPVR